MSHMLELRNITKRFATILANDRINIRIKPGTIHAIVGENGAGKSTAMKIAFGFYTPDSGQILINGVEQKLSNPNDAMRQGIGMVHQHFMLVDTMTVTENIILGAETGSPFNLDLHTAGKRIRDLSEEFKFKIDPRAFIEDLSVEAQQRVEFLKALYRDARLLILDEPTAVLAPQEVAELFIILRRMRDQGRSIVIITHKLSEVLAISEEVTVMRDGRVVGNLKTAETNASELAKLMVGRDVLLHCEKIAATVGHCTLKVRDLRLRRKRAGIETTILNHLNFEVHAGEIVGIAGVEGNGQSELIETLAGLIDHTEVNGSITLGRTELIHTTPRKCRDSGLSHIPEDRHKRGLFLDFSLEENVILGTHMRAPVVREPFNVLFNDVAVNKLTRDLIRDFDVRPPRPELAARSLSGGNQQKLVIGREFRSNPKLLLVAQPTRGVDIGAIEFIHRKLIALRDAGCAILLVSADLEELMALSDRLLIIYQGRIVGEVDPKITPQEEIGLMMTGAKSFA
ncbi:MAG: ABC transporter ATP-binding protein [Pyrinomonadaceae bacterium]